MTDPQPARRVALRWPPGTEEDAVLDAAEGIGARLEERTVRLGDAVTVGSSGEEGIELVVDATEPRGRVTVGEDTRLELVGPPRSPRRDVLDLLVLVDGSYTMRKRFRGVPRFDHATRAVDALLRSSQDSVRHAGVWVVQHEARALEELAPLREVDPGVLQDVKPRGRSRPVPALAQALETLRYEGDLRNQQAVVLVTDGEAPMEGLRESVERAENLGVTVHGARVGEPPGRRDPFGDAVESGGGVYQAEGPADLLEPVHDALQEAVGLPPAWVAPQGPGGEVEFEVVLRTARQPEEDA